MVTFSIFFNMKVYCVYSLESPHTISQYKNENHPKLCQICNYGICSMGPKNEFEIAMVNEPSVFEALKFYCILRHFIPFHETIHSGIPLELPL